MSARAEAAGCGIGSEFASETFSLMEQATASKIDVGRYFRILKRRKWWAIIPLMVLIPAVIAIAAMLPARYPAECLLDISATQSEEELSYAVRIDRRHIADAKLEHLKNIMLSYNNVRSLIVGGQGVQTVPGLSEGINKGSEREVEKLVEEIVKDIRITPQGTQYITVSYLGETEAISLGVVTRLVDNFLEEWMRRVKQDMQDALQQRNEELESFRRELELAEKTLRQFREEHLMELLARDPDFLMKRLSDVQERLGEIEWEMNASKQKLAFVKERLESTAEVEETAAIYRKSIKARKLDENIADLEIGLLMMRDAYTEDHPRVRQTKAQIDLLTAERERTEDEKAESTQERNPTYDKLREERIDCEVQIQMLEAERVSKQAIASQLSQDLKRVPSLLEAKSTYETKVQELKGQITESSRKREDARRRYELAQFSRYDAFRKLYVRSSPNRDWKTMIRFAIVGGFIAFAAATTLVVGKEYLDQSFTAVDDARSFLRIPSLGVVPVIMTRRDRRRKRLRWLVCVVTILLLIGAAVAVWFASEPVREFIIGQWNRAMEMIGQR